VGVATTLTELGGAEPVAVDVLIVSDGCFFGLNMPALANSQLNQLDRQIVK